MLLPWKLTQIGHTAAGICFVGCCSTDRNKSSLILMVRYIHVPLDSGAFGDVGDSTVEVSLHAELQIINAHVCNQQLFLDIAGKFLQFQLQSINTDVIKP